MILDTNGLSAFFDGHEAVIARLARAEAVHLPVVVIGEYRFGLRRSRLRKQREPALTEFIRSCAVLPVLESTTSPYAAIKEGLKKAGTPVPENDIWIAALAAEHRLPILSNDRHFDLISMVKRISW